MKFFTSRETRKRTRLNNSRSGRPHEVMGIESLESRAMMTAAAPPAMETPDATTPTFRRESLGINLISFFDDFSFTAKRRTPVNVSDYQFDTAEYRINGQLFGFGSCQQLFFGQPLTVKYGGITYDGIIAEVTALVPRGLGDTTKPTVAISSSKTALAPGEAATVTFTLSEASYTFRAADVRVQGGTLTNFRGDGKAYTATFTATAMASQVSTVASITVDADRFTDAAANTNSAATLRMQVDSGLATFDFSVICGQPTITKYKGTSRHVEIPEKIAGLTVRVISDNVFRNSSIQSIKLSSGLRILPYNLFRDCPSLQSIKVVVTNPVYQSSDGVLYSRDSQGINTLLTCPRAKTGAVTIPQGVRSIAPDAFNGAAISGVTVPATVTTIRNRAFSGTRNLQWVDFKGHAPVLQSDVFRDANSQAVVYFVNGTKGWAGSYGGLRTICRFAK